MTSEAKYHYGMTSMPHDQRQVALHMKEWADAGWELVSGSATTEVSLVSGSTNILCVMYWRKPITH
jgi:hypothetical protein